METYAMFLDWKSQHCENDCITQSNLQIQWNLCETIEFSILYSLVLYSLENQNKNVHNWHVNTKDPKQPRQSCKRKTKLHKSTVLTSDYTTKLNHGTDTKIEIQTNGTRQKSQNKNPCDNGHLLFDKGGMNIYNGETVSLL